MNNSSIQKRNIGIFFIEKSRNISKFQNRIRINSLLKENKGVSMLGE